MCNRHIVENEFYTGKTLPLVYKMNDFNTNLHFMYYEMTQTLLVNKFKMIDFLILSRGNLEKYETLD